MQYVKIQGYNACKNRVNSWNVSCKVSKSVITIGNYPIFDLKQERNLAILLGWANDQFVLDLKTKTSYLVNELGSKTPDVEVQFLFNFFSFSSVVIETAARLQHCIWKRMCVWILLEVESKNLLFYPETKLQLVHFECIQVYILIFLTFLVRNK